MFHETTFYDTFRRTSAPSLPRKVPPFQTRPSLYPGTHSEVPDYSGIRPLILLVLNERVSDLGLQTLGSRRPDTREVVEGPSQEGRRRPTTPEVRRDRTPTVRSETETDTEEKTEKIPVNSNLKPG